jgi:hypothetical protein
MKKYCNNFFAKQAAFYFDIDFLDLVSKSRAASGESRESFKRRPRGNIEALYAEARRRTARAAAP